MLNYSLVKSPNQTIWFDILEDYTRYEIDLVVKILLIFNTSASEVCSQNESLNSQKLTRDRAKIVSPIFFQIFSHKITYARNFSHGCISGYYIFSVLDVWHTKPLRFCVTYFVISQPILIYDPIFWIILISRTLWK